MDTENEALMELEQFSEKMESLRATMAGVVVAQERAVELLLTCLVADGHALIEGVPGVAKTLTARLLAKLMGVRFSRIQFTPDLMPSDILGTTVYNMQGGTFDFHPGPVFADVVLADEINRAPAKTQSALFEVMEERQATIDGQCHPMGPVFTVIATQNPVEQEGTYRLPEAQLDRFLMKIEMGYPSLDDEVTMLQRHNANAAFARLADVKPLLTEQQLLWLRGMVAQVVVDASLLRYIAQIVALTRDSRAVYLGASPRASIATLQAAKAHALILGRDFVTPDDIQAVMPAVLQHRLLLTAEAEMQGYTPAKVARALMEKVEVPK